MFCNKGNPEDDLAACPGADPEIFQLTDEGIAEYIEFPKDTIFLESMAANETFAPGVGYIAAQRTTGPEGQPETYVYEVRPGMGEAKELFGPLATEGGTETTVFGSDLTSDGTLYLCCFNRNSLITYDMNNPPAAGEPAMCNLEIPNLASPNDMCYDPKNEKILYVCGGTFRNLLGIAKFSNSAYGQVFKVTVNEDGTGATVETIQKGLDTLAGIEVIGDNVWVAELFDVFTLDQTAMYDRIIRWKGNDGTGSVWMADNIDQFEYKEGEDKLVLCPAYSTVPESTVNNILKRNFAMSMVLFGFQIFSPRKDGETLRDALWDPEVSLGFSNTFIEYDDDGNETEPAPIRLFMMTPDCTKSYHFEIDLKQTRAEHDPWEPEPEKNPGKLRHFFNEQVTHSSHLKGENGSGYLVCVNFEEPRILLLKDEKFKNCIAQKDAST